MNPGMIKKLQKMQRDMVNAQKELEASTFYGSAAGVVDVEFYGSKQMKNITINPDALEDKDDIEMIQDTIIAAVNDCMKKIDDETQRVMSQFTGGGMPGLF